VAFATPHRLAATCQPTANGSRGGRVAFASIAVDPSAILTGSRTRPSDWGWNRRFGPVEGRRNNHRPVTITCIVWILQIWWLSPSRRRGESSQGSSCRANVLFIAGVKGLETSLLRILFMAGGPPFKPGYTDKPSVRESAAPGKSPHSSLPGRERRSESPTTKLVETGAAGRSLADGTRHPAWSAGRPVVCDR